MSLLPRLTSIVCTLVSLVSIAISVNGYADDSAWLQAVSSSDRVSLQQLINQTENIDLVTDRGRSALMVACRSGDLKLVNVLLDRGADVNRANDNGGTPLMFAAVSDNLLLIRRLLGAGARVNVQGANGWSALMVAAAKGHLAVVDALFKAGAELNIRDVYGWTPIIRASYQGRSKMVAYLLATTTVDINLRDDQGATALHHAATGDHCESARMLLAAGADSRLKDHYNLTPFDRAQKKGSDSCLKLLGSVTQ